MCFLMKTISKNDQQSNIDTRKLKVRKSISIESNQKDIIKITTLNTSKPLAADFFLFLNSIER